MIEEIRGKIKEIKTLIKSASIESSSVEKKIDRLIKENNLIPFNFFLYEMPLNKLINFSGVDVMKVYADSHKIIMIGEYSKGVELPEHYHDVSEKVEVIQGTFKELFNDIELKEGESYTFDPFCRHEFLNLSKKRGKLRITLFH